MLTNLVGQMKLTLGSCLELVDYIVKPIAFLLNKTMEHGEIPRDWKSANVSPIYKKGAKNKAENYRPISLTSIV